MNNHPTTCDPRRIAQCLSDSLSDDDRADFEAHLEACPVCRQAMEQSAAEPGDWQSAREFLSSHDESHAAESRHADPADDNSFAAVDGVLNVLAPTDDPRMLGRLGQYEVAGVVGRGGMGVVLKALDPALNRYVAIKVLAPHLATSGAARQRFAREARAAASVVHENVVAIHAVTEVGPLPYFVMPYLRGASLQKRLDEQGPLGVPEILQVAMQIAAGLAAAHSQGLVHRDIKPANILLEDGVERLKITDFGLARAADDASLTRTGVIAGTPQFMSPEQARGDAVDPRSDLFSLASVMYAMCTGRPPFRAETSYGILQRICDDTSRAIREINPDMPEWLAAIVDRLHAKNPEERFQTAGEVAELLERCLAHLRQPAAVPLPPAVADLVAQSTSASRKRRAAWLFSGFPLHARRAASFLPERRRWIALVGMSSVVVVVVVMVLSWLWRAGPPHPGPFDEAHGRPLPKGEGDMLSADILQESANWNDDVARQIVESQAAVRRIERGASISWSAPPADDVNQELFDLNQQLHQLELGITAPWGAETQTLSPGGRGLPRASSSGQGEVDVFKKPSDSKTPNQEKKP